MGRDDLIYSSYGDISGHIKRLEAQRDEAIACVDEIARKRSRTMFGYWNEPGARMESDICTMTHRIELRLEPLRWVTCIADHHPLDTTPAILRERTMMALSYGIADQFAIAMYKQFENTQRKA